MCSPGGIPPGLQREASNVGSIQRLKKRIRKMHLTRLPSLGLAWSEMPPLLHQSSPLRHAPLVTFIGLGAVASVMTGTSLSGANRGESMSKAKLTILYGEGDEEVLAQQAAAFQKAGHTVHQAIGRKPAEEALKKSKFDLVILGTSMSRNDRHHLPYMVKKANAETKVFVLHADGSRHPYVDACVDSGTSMESILHKIDDMKLGTPAKTAAATAGR